MATETQNATSVVTSSNLVSDTNVYADDTAWATASSDNSDSVIHVGFPTPSGNPTATQGFTVKYRVTANASSVTFNAYVYENGTALNGGAAVDTWASTSTTEATREVSWNASLLGVADGSGVEAYVVATKSGGSPSNRTTGEFQYIDWDVNYAGADALLATSVETTSEVTAPALAELVTHALLADDVETTSETATVTATGVNGMASVSVETTSELTTPAATGVNGMASVSVESLSELTTPTASESAGEHVLLATSVESASELTTPNGVSIATLLATSVETTSELTTPTATGVNGLNVVNVASLSELTTPTAAEAVAGVDALLAQSVQSISLVSSPSSGAPWGKRINGQSSHSIAANTSTTYYYRGSGFHSMTIN